MEEPSSFPNQRPRTKYGEVEEKVRKTWKNLTEAILSKLVLVMYTSTTVGDICPFGCPYRCLDLKVRSFVSMSSPSKHQEIRKSPTHTDTSQRIQKESNRQQQHDMIRRETSNTKNIPVQRNKTGLWRRWCSLRPGPWGDLRGHQRACWSSREFSHLSRTEPTE